MTVQYRQLFALCSVILTPFVVRGAERVSRSIELPARTQEELVAVRLDSDVYELSEPALDDLRIYDAKGQEVGYILRTVPATETTLVRRTGTFRASQLSLKPLQERGLEITLTLDENDPAPDGLRLVTPLANFEQHIAISASADGETWEPLADGLLFDYSRYMDVRSDTVKLPKTPHKRLRIIVDDVTVEQESELLELTRRMRGEGEAEQVERVLVDRRPFRIDRVEFWTEQAEQQTKTTLLTDYPLVGFKSEEDAEHKQTHILIESRSQPLTSLQVETEDRNFSRNVTVERERTVGVQTDWEPIGSGQLSRIDFRSIQREELTLAFGETRSKRCRLVIENRDSPPLSIKAVTARGPVQELVFLAAADGSYSLGYGGDFDRPNYDTTAIQAVLTETKTPVLGTLAKDTKPLAAPAPNLINNPWLLTAIIVLLVAALAWGLYHAAQRVDQVSGGQSPKVD